MDVIDTHNVARLGLAWSLDLPGERTLQATPLAIDGVLYITGSYSDVYAVNARTGRLLWKHDPEVWKHDPAKMHFALPSNRGVAYSEGRIFAGTLDGRLQALDAKTGGVLDEKLVKVNWAHRIDVATGRPVEASLVHYGNGEATIWPGPLGAHSVQSMSYGP